MTDACGRPPGDAGPPARAARAKAARVGQAARQLAQQREGLLAFAGVLDTHLAALVEACGVSVAVAREVLAVQCRGVWDEGRWPREAALRERLGER